jgi:hypothetical protein
MSFDVHVTVRRGLALAEINEALVALEAPFAIGELRLKAGADGAQPDWSKPFQGGNYQAFPLLPSCPSKRSRRARSTSTARSTS